MLCATLASISGKMGSAIYEEGKRHPDDKHNIQI